MPIPSDDSKNQKAVLYPFSRYDEAGQPLVDFSQREEIDVRWDDGTHESVGADGNVQRYDAGAAVEQEVVVGGIMYKGTLASIPGTSEVPTERLYQVVTYAEAEDIVGDEILRRVRLMRFTDTLPVA